MHSTRNTHSAGVISPSRVGSCLLERMIAAKSPLCLANVCRMFQENAQETVRALLSEIECNGSAKTLSGKLFQGLVISYECLQKILL